MELTTLGPLPPAVVDPALIRQVCGQFVTGVTALTSLDDGEPVGVTINSFTSVSLDPPLVLCCVHHRSRVLPALRSSGVFAVNILAEDQEEISLGLARAGGGLITAVDARHGVTGAPLIPGILAFLDCTVREVLDGGDHVIVIGQVVDLEVVRADGGPLMFFRSAHRALR